MNCSPTFPRSRHPSNGILQRLLILGAILSLLQASAQPAPQLPGTAPLTWEGDIAARMVSGIDRYLDRVTIESIRARTRKWPAPNVSGDRWPQDFLNATRTNRVRLAQILGVTDTRDTVSLQLVAPVGADPDVDPAWVGDGPGYRVYAVRWNVFRGVEGEGLLVMPVGTPTADVIAVPDCDWTPEQILGLAPGVPLDQQFARRFAEAGCRVLIPALIDRGDRFAGNPEVRTVKHSQRETLWRASYQMGRHPLGYEIQKVLAAAAWMESTRPQVTSSTSNDSDAPQERRLGLIGYGEGGLIALYAGALDTRFHAVTVCGAFGLTQRHADLPIYRNVWSLLERFGDAEVAAMIAPRSLIIEHGKYPNASHTDQHGGAPGLLWRPDTEGVAREIARIQEMFEGVPSIILATSPDAVCDPATALRFYEKLTSNNQAALLRGPLPRLRGVPVDAAARTRRQYLQILNDTQHLMHESPYQRASFWKPADRSSLQNFAATVTPLKEYFKNEVIGVIPPASLSPQPRTRFLYQTNGYTG